MAADFFFSAGMGGASEGLSGVVADGVFLGGGAFIGIVGGGASVGVGDNSTGPAAATGVD